MSKEENPFKTAFLGAREIVQQLKEHTVLSEDPSLASKHLPGSL